MWLDLSPLRRYRDYRLLFIGQGVSYLGSMLSYVALPYQMYELTRSSFAVGLIGTVELLPLLFFALWGGALADALDRRRLLIHTEIGMLCGSALMAWNALREHPSIWLLYLFAGLMGVLNGLHRPSLDALVPRLVKRDDLPAIAALRSLNGSIGAIAGPALAGLLISRVGLSATFLIDVATFLLSLLLLAQMRVGHDSIEEEAAERPGLASIRTGLRYAISRPELIGTYVVDLLAMTFAMPLALFPALSERWGGASAVGWLYGAMPIGSLATTLLSGWTKRVRRHGCAVILAAATWGLAIVALAYAPSLGFAVGCLVAAGAADMVSGLFRMTIWNETIPTTLRGRLAGVEMISYLAGPLLGNARAGWMASVSSLHLSILSGGILCVVGVLSCVPLLPRFWNYRSQIGTPGPLDTPTELEGTPLE